MGILAPNSAGEIQNAAGAVPVAHEIILTSTHAAAGGTGVPYREYDPPA